LSSLARRLFAPDINNARQGEWTMADDGRLHTLPIASEEVRIGRMSN
jgi:ribonuclease Z